MLAATGHLFVPLLVATGIASAAWILLFVGWVVSTRPGHVDPGPATMLDLEHEPLPPAVVNLLVNRGHVENEAAAATLIDLAARGILSIEPAGRQQEMCRLQPATNMSGLLPHERLVLDRVQSQASNGTVPLAALNSAPEGVDAWRKWFNGTVVDEARRRGLARPRMTQGARILLIASALVPAALAFAAGKAAPVTNAGGTQEPAHGAGVVGAIIVLVVFTAVVFALPRFWSGSWGERPTPKGVLSTASWLGFRDYLRRDKLFSTLPPSAVAVWKRNLAYGAALGVAASVAHALPFGREPDREAWSSETGQWRIVRVAYPRRLLWGRSPWRSLFRGLILLALAGGIVFAYQYARVHAAQFTHQDISQGLAIASIVIFAFIVPLFALFGLTYFWRGLIDVFSASQVEGLVVRLRRFRTPTLASSRNQVYNQYLAVDDGSHERIRAYRVDVATYQQVGEGTHVRLRATKHLGYVSRFSVVDTEKVGLIPVATSSGPRHAVADAFGPPKPVISTPGIRTSHKIPDGEVPRPEPLGNSPFSSPVSRDTPPGGSSQPPG